MLNVKLCYDGLTTDKRVTQGQIIEQFFCESNRLTLLFNGTAKSRRIKCIKCRRSGKT